MPTSNPLLPKVAPSELEGLGSLGVDLFADYLEFDYTGDIGAGDGSDQIAATSQHQSTVTRAPASQSDQAIEWIEQNWVVLAAALGGLVLVSVMGKGR